MEKKHRPILFKRSFSEWLSRRSEKLSSGVKKTLLLILFVATGAYCVSLIIGNGKAIFLSQNISFPGIGRPDEKAGIQQRIQLLGSYLDSLQTTSDGRMVYDSLLQTHPHIYDSIANWKEQLKQLP